MNIQKKILLIIFTSLSVLFGSLYLGIRHIIISNHLDIEDNFNRKDILRVKEAYANMVMQLGVKSSDWGNWDDTYKFIQDHNKDYIKSNMTDVSLQNLGIHFMLFVDNQKKMVAGKYIDEDTGIEKKLTPDILKLATESNQVLQSPENTFEKGGLILIDEKPAIIFTRPILTSNKTGPSKGTLIFGFFITKERHERVANLVHLNIHFGILKNIDLENTILEPQIRIISEDLIEGKIAIKNIYDQAQFYTTIDEKRPIYQEGLRSVHLLALIMAISAVFLSAIIYFSLHHILIKRLSRVYYDLNKITEQKNHYLRVHEMGCDEMGQLAKHINSTIDSLQKSQDELATTQQQLLQSQKLESIGKLAGGIAHDFNNILGSILGYATLLKDKLASDPNISKKLDIIITSSQRGAELTKQLLGFARRGKYEKKEIDPNQIIEECINLLHSTAKGITIEKILDPKTCHMEGDGSQLLQVILNLGINARDAMPDGGKVYFGSQNTELDTLAIKSLNAPQHITPGLYVHLTVRDTGTGISKEIQDKIYDPFFTTKGSGKGSGMGLATALGIVENHGGFITFSSSEGQGTTFHLFFKATKATENKSVPVSITKKGIDLKVIKDKSILITDDEEVLRDYVADILTPYAPHTIFAADGDEAIQASHSEKLDLAILDIIMPKKDGFQAYEAIHQKHPLLPIIFVSGYNEDTKMAELRKKGNIYFVQKPYKPEFLLETISTALTEHHPSSENT